MSAISVKLTYKVLNTSWVAKRSDNEHYLICFFINLIGFIFGVENANMAQYHQPLLPNHIYHLFSRAVGNEKLFVSPENYLFFLKKLKQHTSAVCKYYSYSLLPNHFHLLAKINEEESLVKHFEKVKKTAYNPEKHSISDFVMERFSNCLNSYTKSFNKTYNRKGALFMDYMKRSVVNEPSDFTAYEWYIHKNAVHHNLAGAVGEWPFDSYHSILSEAPTNLLREEVIKWFGGKEEFVRFHRQKVLHKVKVIEDI